MRYLIVFIVPTVLLVWSLCLLSMVRNAPLRWHLLADGALERIDVREEKRSRRSGSMVHTKHHYTVHYSTLRFVGGAVIYDIPGKLTWPAGTTVLVQLMKSNHGTYRLEAYGSDIKEG